MIGVVDYGLGNIQAFLTIYRRHNIPAMAATTPEQLARCDRLILPGVGAFDWAMSRLDASGLRPTLEQLVLDQQRPILGVCVGMQMLARRSEEGAKAGLGWLNAEVYRFQESEDHSLHVPHMGWNDAAPETNQCLFHEMREPRFYFLHSYYFIPHNAQDTLARTQYNVEFASAVRSGHIYGTQFHPEKSHGCGIELLKNFASQ